VSPWWSSSSRRAGNNDFDDLRTAARVGVGEVVEVVELLLEAFDVGVTALFPVQLQCFPPDRAGLVVLPEGGVGVADVVEGVREPVGVAEGSTQGEGLVIVVDGLLVLAGAVGDESEAVQRVRLARGVGVVSEQGEGGETVVAGGV
jgi:hypothetical protein